MADFETFPVLRLTPINGTFETRTISVPFYPDVIHIRRTTDAVTTPATRDVYFASNTLSRLHAQVWADRSGKIWIRDTKSTNGTFVNGQRLSPEGVDSDPLELRKDYVLKWGIDILDEDKTTPVHHSIVARVDHVGFLEKE